MVKQKFVIRGKSLTFGLGIILAFLILVFAIRYFSLFWGIAVDKKIQVRQTSGNINMLILGIGGGTHEGPDLTDTIILASLHPDKNRVDILSIPRDLYVESLKSKINAAYANGQEKEGKGMLLVRSAISSITGVHPDYVVVVDFSGFIKLVDLLGGIDVAVERPLNDYAYPVEGKEQELCGVEQDGIASFSAQIATGSATEFDIFPCRYTPLHVPAGLQHMDGALALKFVRSRHALGIEGSDFARSSRQQLVINAVRNKVLSLGTLSNPLKIIGMINILRDNIHMDIPEDQVDDFIKLANSMKGAKIKSYVIDQGDSSIDRYGLLINPPLSDYNGMWVLAPRAGRDNYSEIKEYISCVFSGDNCIVGKDSVIKISPTPSASPMPSR